MPPSRKPLLDADYARLADFRYALRRFQSFSEEAAATEAITPQQHQALLMVRGRESGTTSIGILAERLCLRHHSAVELVQRLETAGLVTKDASAADRRVIVLTLTEEGLARLERLSLTHREELRRLGPELIASLSALAQA